MKADVIVVDPPRKGCEETLLDTIVQMEPKRIVYVSCDPATLARDLKILCGKGYEVKRVRGCDMFSQSYHVEACVLLSKTSEAKSEIRDAAVPASAERESGTSYFDAGRKSGCSDGEFQRDADEGQL